MPSIITPTVKFPALYLKDINRLISSWHPTGRILFQDDMESLIADATNHYKVTAGTMARANDKAFSGQYSLKLTTGAIAGNAASAALYLSLPKYLTKIGFEIKWISTATITNLRMLKIAMTRYDGAADHQCDIRYYGTFTTLMEKWQYLNSAGGLTDIFTQKLRISDTEPAWNGVKIIANFKNDEYESFISNEKSKDLSGIAMRSVASAVEPELGIYLEIVTETANAINGWFDDLILTDEG